MKNGSIMDKYLEDIIRDIRIIFLKHSRELCEVECKKADEEAAEKLETLDNSSRDKQDNIEERYDQIDKIFEQRKDVLQFHRTSFASHQVSFRPEIHGPAQDYQFCSILARESLFPSKPGKNKNNLGCND